MNNRKYFGTDGIRGAYGSSCMNPGFARAVGAAAGRWLLDQSSQKEGLSVIIGRDTRASGRDLTEALAEGFSSQGITVIDAGIAPTPSIPMALLGVAASLGVAVTASHNPWQDNGIKFFDAEGLKLTDETEITIESYIEAILETPPEFPAAAMGRFDAAALYRTRLIGLMDGARLDGWVIACDTANGATVETTPSVLSALGATVEKIGDTPNGQNINKELGSEHPAKLAELVKQSGAHIGIAHDGDGDRLVLCDETGSILDGDEVLAMIALHLLKHKRLKHDTLVATIMSNLGLDAAIRKAGGQVTRVGVGDRYVLEAMVQHGYNFGGEASGHIILKDYSTTGDGLLAALQVIQMMLDTGKPLSELRKVMRFFPQEKKNLKVRERVPFEQLPGFNSRLAEIDAQLNGMGRTLVRYSGTESKIRLLVEAETDEAAKATLHQLEVLVQDCLEVES